MTARKTPLFHKGHYNTLAARINEQVTQELNNAQAEALSAVLAIAVRLAWMFERERTGQDGYAFDSDEWFHACVKGATVTFSGLGFPMEDSLVALLDSYYKVGPNEEAVSE